MGILSTFFIVQQTVVTCKGIVYTKTNRYQPVGLPMHLTQELCKVNMQVF